VIAELPAGGPEVTVEERDILQEPELHEKYVEDIPVVLVDGRMHTYWRVDPVRLRTALLEAR
jgi:predicted thioredoxin/glutaredoxin